MRLAVLADIHGNLPAFEAVLEHLDRQKVDGLIIAGDTVNCGPDSAACWSLAQAQGCPVLRGNHERYVYDLHAPGAPPEWRSPRFAPTRWTYAQCNEAMRSQMAEAPFSLRPEGTADLLVVHASKRADNDALTAHTPTETLGLMFAGCDDRLIVRGHNHIPGERQWDGRSIVTTGSVGFPVNGEPTAQYLLLERGRSGWRWQHHWVPYDLDAVETRFRTSGYLDAAGPMARLYLREALTATFQLTPFLRLYRRWSPTGELDLETAVRRFLALA